MPTYDYRCEHCGNFEAVHGMKDPSLAACPTCGRPVTRLISKGGGLIFKGSGFYITDYRSADYKQKAEKESADAKPAAPEAKPAAGGDAKPAAGGDAKPAAAPPAASGSPASSGGSGSSSASSSSSSSSSSGPASPSGGSTPA